MAQIKLAEYTFDNSVGDCLPTLRLSSIEMTTEDIVSGVVTRRTVYIDDTTLPYRLYFQNQTALLTVDYLHIGSNITDLSSMFSGCTKLKTVNTTNWDLSSVTNFSFMFQKCSSLTKLDLRNWVTSSATTMQGMFHSCTSLTEIKGIENFNVSSVQNFGSMFYNCKTLLKLDLRNWVTSAPTIATMQDMFSGCESLELLRVDNFDTSKLQHSLSLNGMFQNCKKLKTLNLNSFVNPGNLGNSGSYFYGCSSLEYISMNNFVFGNCTSMGYVFMGCTNLKILDLTQLDTTTMTHPNLDLMIPDIVSGVTCPIYYNSNTCNHPAITRLSNAIDVQGRLMAVYDFNNSETGTNTPTLTGSTVTKTIDTQGSESHITHRVIGVDVMPIAISFNSMRGLLNVDYLAVTSGCTSLVSLFENCFRMTYVDTFGWDTSNVTRFGYCFRNCNSLTEIRNIQDLKVTSKVTEAYDFFNGCSKLTSLDLTHWDVSGIRNGSVMFSGCSGLTSLNISNWDVSSMVFGNSMFQGCTSLSELDLTSFKTTAMESDNHNMFSGWTSDQIVYVHDTNWTIDTSSYNATFVRRLSTLLAKYTFDNSIGDCLPTITGITTSDYKVSDIVNDTITTRFLSTDSDKVITKISFGSLGKTSSLLTLDYLKIDKNITAMNDMFQVCSNVTTINAENWDTSNVTNMAYMLQRCDKLTEVKGLGTWDTSKVTAMDAMFQNKAGNIKEIENWDVSSCKNFSYMFASGGINSELNLSNWQPNNLENCQNMFANSPFTSINLSGWNVPKLSNMSSMFAGIGAASKLTSVNMSNWTMGTPANMNSMFYNNANLTSIDFTGSKMVSSGLQQTFQTCTKLTSLDLSGWSAPNTIITTQAFFQCNVLNSLKLFEMKSNNMNGMFHRCQVLQTLDVSGIDVSNVKDMFNMFSECSALTEIIGISRWNTTNVTNIGYAFNNCSSLTELDLSNWDTRKVTEIVNAFAGWTSDQTVYYQPPYWSLGTTSLNSDINWVINITRNNGYWLDMTGITGDTEIKLFNENNLPTEEILTDWGDGTRNSELTHTYSTAGEYVVVSNLQLGRHENTTVRPYLVQANIYYKTSLQYLFESCTKLKTVTFADNFINILNQQGTQNFFRLFNGCSLLTDTNEEQWKKLKPNDMTQTFTNCASLITLDLENFDTSEVKTLQNTFLNCSALTEIKGIEKLDVSNITSLNSTFKGCGIPTLNLSKWKFKDGVNMYQCFNGSKITSIDLSNTTIKSGFQELFYNCKSLETVNLSGATLTGTMQAMFSGCNELTSIDFTGATIKPTNLYGTFNNCLKLTTIDTSTWDLSDCTSLTRCFVGCSGLTSIIGIEDWNVEKVTNMEGTFQACSKLELLDLSSWNVSKCTTMANMFNGCSSLTSLDLSSWNTDNVTTTNLMFNNCSSIKELDLSSFTTTKLTNITYMLERCSSLKTLDISNFNLDNFSPTQMFYSTQNIENIGLLYVSSHTVNLISQQIPKDNANLQIAPITIYYYDADPSQLTPVEGVTFKKYSFPTTIQLPPHIQLHSLPDGTRDEVDIKTGILTRNVGCLVLDGSEDEKYGNNWSNNGRVYPLGNNFIESQTVICDKLIRGKDWSDTAPDHSYGLRQESDGSYRIVLVLDNKWTNGANNIQGLREYLSSNPITFFIKQGSTTEQLILNYNNSCDYGRILPTGMCDKYSVVDSMYTQTMTSILLDGANTWDAMEEFENTVKFTATGTTVGVEELNMLGAGGLYCDNDLFPNINDDSDVPHCRVDETGNKFYIYVDKEMLMSPDLIGWQIWLQANKFNMIYELAEHLTYVKPYEELDPTQARWEGMDCMRDGAIRYHTNSSDNITMYPTLEYVAPSINNFEVTMLEPNTDYTIYAEGINANDTINLGGTDINFNNGTVYTSGDNQWLRIDNNDSFYNVVITKGDTTGEVVPYFEGMASVKMPVLRTVGKNLFNFDDYEWKQGGLNDAGYQGTTPSYSSFINVDKVPIEKIFMDINKEVYLTCKMSSSVGWVQVFFYDKNGNACGRSLNHAQQGYLPITLNVPKNAKFFRMQLSTDDISSIVATYNRADCVPYVPYKSNILTFNEPVKLRSLPNGVKDTINVVTGEYVQRIGEVVLNGSEDWVLSAHDNSTQFYTPLNNLVRKVDYLNSMSCDKLAVHTDSESLYYSTLPNGVSAYVDWPDEYPNENWLYIKHAGSESSVEKFKQWLKENPVTVQYELAEPITTKLDPQTLLAYKDGTINLSSDTGLLPTTHYTVPSTNTFHLPSMKTGTRYTLKYPSASGSITIGDINYSISSDSMLFTTPLKINGDTSAIIFSDANPENVVLLEGAYNKREVPFFTGVKSVKNPNITIIDQLSTESTTYNCETEIELRGLPNGVADKLDIIKGKLTTNVGIRPYQEGDENLPNIWTDGYETVYALSSPVVKNVTIDRPTVTTNSLIELSSDYLIPQLNYRAPSSNNFPLDLLQPNTTYTLYADTLASGSYTLGGTRTGVYSQPHTITLGDMTDNLLTFNGDLGLSNVMLVKGNSLKTSLPPYFLGIRSVTDGHLLVEGMAGEINEITFDEGIVLRDCNGVKDIIDLITCTLTKRTGEITLTGAEGWYRADSESTTDYNVFKLTLGGLKEALVMCDTLQSVFDTKMMDCIHAHTNELCIVIANATIGGNTVNALKSWLNQHPTTVVYQLRTPIEVQLENTWTTLPPTSYDNQTEISSTVSTNSLKPMISVTIATTTLEEIISNLEAQNEELENENVATMLALTSVYELMSTSSVATTETQVATYELRRSAEPIGMSVSPMGMVYARLVSKGFKSIDEVPYNLQTEVMYALRGME